MSFLGEVQDYQWEYDRIYCQGFLEANWLAIEMNSQLVTFFDAVSSESHLRRLTDEKREENLYLEFKRKRDPRDAVLHDDDRKNFSKALASFANADGGILIFGIITTRSSAPMDQASELAPITDFLGFGARLRDSILNSTQPPVDEVRIETIPSDAVRGAGYIKCLIPQSVRPPHRAMLAERRYWIRTSSGSREMEHYELEDVFGRRLRPSLELVLELRLSPGDESREELHFWLRNVGRGIAQHAGLFCRLCNVEVEGVHGSGLVDDTRINADKPTLSFYYGMNVIHTNGIAHGIGYALLRRIEMPRLIRAKWYAENCQTREFDGELQIGPQLLAGCR